MWIPCQNVWLTRPDPLYLYAYSICRSLFVAWHFCHVSVMILLCKCVSRCFLWFTLRHFTDIQPKRFADWTLIAKVSKCDEMHVETFAVYHRRRTRASPVLTAIGLVNGKPWDSHFSPSTKSTYLNRSLKNLSQAIRSTTSTAVQILVEIRPWGASGQIGEILTIFRFLFIPLF